MKINPLFLTLSLSFIFGCSPNKFFLKKNGYDKKEINELIEQTDLTTFASFHDSKGKLYRIQKSTLEENRDSLQFADIMKLSYGKLKGPTSINDSTDLFLKKLETGTVHHFKTTMANVHQPVGMSDGTFEEEIQKIKDICRSGVRFSDVKNRYDSETPLKLGLILPSDWTHENKMIPEVRDFLKTAEVGEFFQTEKAVYPQTTYLTLIEKSAENRIFKTVTYVRLTVKKQKDDR